MQFIKIAKTSSRNCIIESGIIVERDSIPKLNWHILIFWAETRLNMGLGLNRVPGSMRPNLISNLDQARVFGSAMYCCMI